MMLAQHHIDRSFETTANYQKVSATCILSDHRNAYTRRYAHSLCNTLCHPFLPILVCFHTGFNPRCYRVAHGSWSIDVGRWRLRCGLWAPTADAERGRGCGRAGKMAKYAIRKDRVSQSCVPIASIRHELDTISILLKDVVDDPDKAFWLAGAGSASGGPSMMMALFHTMKWISNHLFQLATMLISKVTDCTRAVHPFPASTSSARGRSGSFLRFGAPNFHEDFVRVQRCDDNRVTHDLSLYYRVYHPSLLHSQESPPLIVLHGGP